MRSDALFSEEQSIRKMQRWVQHIMTDFWFQCEMGPSMVSLAEATQLDISYLNGFRNHDSRRERMTIANALKEFMEKIENRQAILTADIGVVYLMPEPDQPCGKLLARSLNEREEWCLWSRCHFCGHNQYLPVIMNGENYAACYHCIPPSQYPSFGAKHQDGSLLRYALDEMGILSDIESLKPPEPPVKKRARKPKHGYNLKWRYRG